MRRMIAWLAKRRLAPSRNRYCVTLETTSLSLRCDWATPETIGRWLGDLLELGALDPPEPGYYPHRLSVVPIRPRPQ